jgi:hypothetical protein
MRMRRPNHRSLDIETPSALTERSPRKNNRWPQHAATDSEIAVAKPCGNSKFSTTSRKKSGPRASNGQKYIAFTFIQS